MVSFRKDVIKAALTRISKYNENIECRDETIFV